LEVGHSERGRRSTVSESRRAVVGARRRGTGRSEEGRSCGSRREDVAAIGSRGERSDGSRRDDERGRHECEGESTGGRGGRVWREGGVRHGLKSTSSSGRRKDLNRLRAFDGTRRFLFEVGGERERE